MKRVVLVVAMLVLWCSLAQATVFFSHPYDSNSENAYSSVQSYGDQGPYHQSFADYYYDGSFAITDFHWWGDVWNDNADIDHFVFQIYDHDVANSRPGSLVYEQSVAGDANATFVETNSHFGDDIYRYSLDLNSPFAPATVGYYWFSVYAVGGNDDFINWFWALGSDHVFNNDWQLLDIQTDPEWRSISCCDFAYELSTDGVVPEPASLTLLALGLVGLAIRRRKN